MRCVRGAVVNRRNRKPARIAPAKRDDVDQRLQDDQQLLVRNVSPGFAGLGHQRKRGEWIALFRVPGRQAAGMTGGQPIPLPAATSAPPGSSSMKPRKDASSPAARCSGRYRTSAKRMCGAISAKISAASHRRPVRLICCRPWQKHGARHCGTLYGRTLNNAECAKAALHVFLRRGLCPLRFADARSISTSKSTVFEGCPCFRLSLHVCNLNGVRQVLQLASHR